MLVDLGSRVNVIGKNTLNGFLNLVFIHVTFFPQRTDSTTSTAELFEKHFASDDSDTVGNTAQTPS